MAQTAQNKEDSDILEKLVEVYRVSKVVKGGRRFSFSAVVVAGDGKGNVGYGHGKAKEVGEARSKATNEAKKNLKRVPLREGRTLHHDVVGKYGSAKVVLRSAPPGTGIIAGGPMRAVFECLGVQDVVGKSLGSSNSHNLIKATFDALFNNASSPRDMANKRGKKVSYIIERRELSKKDTGSGENNDVKETNESE